MDKLYVLVVEDDALAQAVMLKNLAGHRVEVAADFASASEKLGAGEYDLCFLDLGLGKGDSGSGLKLIPAARARGIYTVVMSGFDEEEVVSEAYDLGCDDFYSKGNEEVSVGAVIGKFLRARAGSGAEELFSREFVTASPEVRSSVEEAMKYAAADLPIMILGPSGTGKTRLARVIHDRSGRKGEFVAINCSAYTEDLLEAELFGYRKGAFTGAADSRKGKLLQADGGTLFLDEIGAMSLNMQTKLLKAIEEKSFHPVGTEKIERSNFRVLSATLEDIPRLLKEGRLRFDFFQRVHGLTATLAPLARRPEDIFPLVEFFTRGGKRLSFTRDAKAALRAHSWPGNIRELKKLVERLVSGPGGRVSAKDLEGPLAALPGGTAGAGFATPEQYAYALEMGLDAAVERLISEIVLRNLESNGGKKARTLSDLKISTRRLYSTLRKRDEKRG